MLKGAFDLPMNCNHLMPTLVSAEQHHGSVVKTRLPSLKIAIIAIGNPLVEEDSAAIALVEKLHQTHAHDGFCLFHFDSGFAWLKEVLMRHDIVIILDSILDNTQTADGFTAIPLTRSVIHQSGFLIRATHGLGWLDEIKLIDICQKGELLFFGIDGEKFKTSNENERAKFIESALKGLRNVLDQCISQTSTVQGGSALNA